MIAYVLMYVSISINALLRYIGVYLNTIPISTAKSSEPLSYDQSLMKDFLFLYVDRMIWCVLHIHCKRTHWFANDFLLHLSLGPCHLSLCRTNAWVWRFILLCMTCIFRQLIAQSHAGKAGSYARFSLFCTSSCTYIIHIRLIITDNKPYVDD